VHSDFSGYSAGIREMNLGFRDNSYWAWCFFIGREGTQRAQRQDQGSCLPIPSSSLCSMRSFAAKISFFVFLARFVVSQFSEKLSESGDSIG